MLVLLWERAWCTSSEPQVSMAGDRCEPRWEGGPEDRRGVGLPLRLAVREGTRPSSLPRAD